MIQVLIFGSSPLIFLLFYFVKKLTFRKYQQIPEAAFDEILLNLEAFEKLVKLSARRRKALLSCALLLAVGWIAWGGKILTSLYMKMLMGSMDTDTYMDMAVVGLDLAFALFIQALLLSIVRPVLFLNNLDQPTLLTLVDEFAWPAKVFKTIFSSLLLSSIPISCHFVYSYYYKTLYLQILGWQWLILQPLICILLLIIVKMASNETRFVRKLLIKDTSAKEPKSSFYSQWTFSFVDDMIAIGADRALNMDDLDQLIDGDTSINICERFHSVKKDNQTLAWNLYYLVRKPFLWQQFACLISTITCLAGPILLKLTLDYIANPSTISHPAVPYLYGLALFFATMIRSIGDGQTYFLGRRVGIRIRATLIHLIYQKSLQRTSVESPLDSSVDSLDTNTGKITNLMSVDATKILEVCCYLMYTWSTPLQAIIFISYLIYIAGPPALAGIACMIFVLPFAAYISSWLQKLRKRLMKSTDVRIGAVNELLQAIRIVKFFAWEQRFEKKIGDLRETELNLLWSYIFSSAAYRILWTATPVLVSFATFASMTALSGSSLSISTAFTCLSIFQALQRPIILIPEIVVNVIEAWISYKRIEEYLSTPELEEYINTRPYTSSDCHVRFLSDSKFKWYRNAAVETLSPSKDFSLSNVGLSFPKDGLSIIYGQTGSGKTSILYAILGEMNCVEGGVLLGNKGYHKTKISVAYAPQQVWLQNATIKDNILFGNEYISDRYNRVIKYCALARDLQVLEAGDRTEVGEKGVNLSGGQKARISLARALYSKADVILMDDPLSAVDAPTARHIFEQAICGPLMAGRTRILVTHAVQLCIPKADLVIEMKRGKPIAVDSPPLESPTKDTLSLGTVLGTVHQKNESVTSTLVQNNVHAHQLIEAEARMQGSVELRVYWRYCKAAGGLLFVFLLFLTFCSSQILFISNDIWIKIWTDAYSAHDTLLALAMFAIPESSYGVHGVHPGSSINLFFYIGIYGLIGLSSLVVLFARILIVARASLRASRTLHSSLTHKILRAPVKFFEKTPMGRLVNRFSKDIKDIDMEVAQYSSDFLSNFVRVVSLLAVILVVTPLSLVGFLPVSVFYIFIGRQYLLNTRELKRIDSNTRSPIFSHFGETLQGAAIIRAYAAETRFSQVLHQRVDLNHQAFSLIWILNRWLSVRIDLIGALLGLTTTVAIVFVSQTTIVDAGFAGLSIAYSLGFSDSLIWLVRMHALMEMEMNAVERVDEYLQIEEEAPAIIESNRPPSDWPSSGFIKVQNLTLRYSPEGPPILSDVCFQVSPGEKVGIVGRTGAGKTTLTLAFFRFMEAEAGSIFIDNIDIGKIGVHDLRSNLTVIPQDPVLFEGTLQSNLDPFTEYEDSEIWESLRSCHFLETMLVRQSSGLDHIASTHAKPGLDNLQHNITLETAVTEGGLNFSQGQRQLLCLARAILKRSKVIICDEATASIDHDTDVKIQQTIRDRFKQSSLLVIAHRLSTIMDYDKILVLDKGKVSQFGSPLELIKSPGIFKEMCIETKEFDKLEAIAMQKKLNK